MKTQTNATNEWQAYFAQYGPRLVLFARQWLPDVSDAEDAVQDAFVRFWRKQQNPDDCHAGLLFAAVRHAAFDQIRRDTRRKHREHTAANQGFCPTSEDRSAPWFRPSEPELDSSVRNALQRLAGEQREVLVLKIWGELTFAQISEALDLSPNTVASRYRYAINALRKIIKPVCHE